MEELKRLSKILNIELVIIVIFIAIMGAGVFLVFYQFTTRLDAITTQAESSEAVWALRNIVSWQSEYEVEFRITREEEYAQKFWSTGEQFDKTWQEARAKIILFDPEAGFFYKSNNLRDYHIQFQALVSEIFTNIREDSLEEVAALADQHEILEEKMVEIINEWQELNRKNLTSLRSKTSQFADTIFWAVLLFILLISAIFITISRKFFAPFIRGLVVNLTNRTKELEEAKESLGEAKTILEIKVAARTRELGGLAESLEARVEERTKELKVKLEELQRFQELTIGRELKMIGLKKEMEEISEKINKIRQRRRK